MSNTAYEAKTLKQLHKALSDPRKNTRQVSLLKITLLLIGGVTIIGAYLASTSSTIDPRWSSILAAFGGAIIGVASYLSVAMRQWHYLAPHINTHTVEARIRELET